MKKLLVGLILVLLLVCSVSAIKDNFQDYDVANYVNAPGFYGTMTPVTSTNNEIIMDSTVASECVPVNVAPIVFTYAAWNMVSGGGGYDIYLYDSAYTAITHISITSTSGRYELKVIGGTPTLYKNGALVATASVIAVNPSYIRFGGRPPVDNIVIGDLDHHVVGALPSNWTIQRDLINPSATGVYAWNNATQAWVLKNSYTFYIDADCDSTVAAATENLYIKNFNTGVIVNTTVINPHVPRNQLGFDVNTFLNTATSLGTSLPDGEYTVGFQYQSDGVTPTLPADLAHFWIISSGATIYWNQGVYTQGSAAGLTYTISPSYFDTTTYSYRVDVQDVYGTVKKTTDVNTASGTIAISSLDAATYPPGVYYALVIATKKSDLSEYVMNYAGMEVSAYIVMTGYVINAETLSTIPNANVTVSQGSSSYSSQSLSDGAWNSSHNWLSGISTSIVTSATGYTTDTNSFTPTTADAINLTIPLVPTSPSCSGVCLGGLVRDSVYHSPVNAATVFVTNTTNSEHYTNLTNAAGFYTVNNLVNGRMYDRIYSYKIGWANSTVTQKVVVSS